MSTHEARLQGREEIARGTMAFHFEKPAGFSFRPGQAIDVVLLGLPVTDAPSTRHTFSIVSAPFENELVIATRMRDSAFKRGLGSWAAGAPVAIDGPFGSFTLHGDPARSAVFIAGGIGITPFMSTLRQAASDRSQQALALLYSNRRPEDAAFLAELQALEQRIKSFHLVATMTGMTGSVRPWDGPTGPIDGALVKNVAAGLSKPIYYVVGPPGLVEAMRRTLHGVGVDDEDIRSEAFYGY